MTDTTLCLDLVDRRSPLDPGVSVPLPFSSGTFDTVIADPLDLGDATADVLSELLRVLADHGRFELRLGAATTERLVAPVADPLRADLADERAESARCRAALATTDAEHRRTQEQLLATRDRLAATEAERRELGAQLDTTRRRLHLVESSEAFRLGRAAVRTAKAPVTLWRRLARRSS